ncbi:hypothetical protein [Burkholderia ubonensis]|uniref:hypothetical protein n=1 Tax=Burkholderia ubonensis TaxID=101571 RepID=UPI000A784F08|nr:hypothetical protein [Burkholderia ubonensis]VWB76035.1 hypothetical protein BUB20358_03575 [Burkholderia ubonensis]
MFKRSTAKYLYVMLVLFAMVGSAQAERCNFSPRYKDKGGLSGWPARIRNSSDEALRNAFKNDKCTFIMGEHSGGYVPRGAPNSRHITVSRNGRACHVFKKHPNLRWDARYPTTCF